MIFIDASLPKTLADELKKVRDDVVFKHDIFFPEPTTPYGCGESASRDGLPSPVTRKAGLGRGNVRR